MSEAPTETETSEVTFDSKKLEIAKDTLSTEERVNQALELLEREVRLALTPEEAKRRVNSLKERITFADQREFKGRYYEQYRHEWDKTTAAFVYEPRRDVGREEETQVIILKSGLELTPEALQLALHEGTHFLGPGTEVKKLPEWEIEEIIADDSYLVSTTILSDWLGPVSTTFKDFISVLGVTRDNLESSIKSDEGLRSFNIIDSNVPVEELDDEYAVWEAVTDWYAMNLGKEVMPDYKPITGYKGRVVVEKYLEMAKEKGQEEAFQEGVREALFIGKREKLDKSLTSLGKDYPTFNFNTGC